ncbi:MAG: hypothetical protein LBH50_05020, partial [Spirochaetaceae bacterium]|nr:hypothetical protein [Spirochaetaceae bacterium]
LDASALIKETILMGFRYLKGPDPVLFRRRFGSGLEGLIGRTAARWRDLGLMRPDRTALNKQGLLFLNRFTAEAFEELEGEEARAVMRGGVNSRREPPSSALLD